MPPDFLDVDPDQVAAAGGRTAATAGDWSVWATRVETLLREVATGASDPVVTADVEGHVSDLNPRLHRLAADAQALGGNASSAACVVVDADGSSAATLAGPAAAIQTTGSWLRRPVTGGGSGSW